MDSLASLSIVALLSTLYTAVAASLIGYGIWNTLLAKYPTSAVVPFTLLVPVIGIFAAWVAQGEVPTVTELAGGAIMLTGLATAVVQKTSRLRPSGNFTDVRPSVAEDSQPQSGGPGPDVAETERDPEGDETRSIRG